MSLPEVEPVLTLDLFEKIVRKNNEEKLLSCNVANDNLDGESIMTGFTGQSQ